MLPSLSPPSVALDPLIAEARSRAHERHAQIARVAAAALIVGVSLAGAALLLDLRLVEDISPLPLLSRVLRFEHPWWMFAATIALCLLGVAGAVSVLATAGRHVTRWYTAASALFAAGGVGCLADTKLIYVGMVGQTNLGRTNLAVALLLLGLVSAVLALTCWSRRRQPDRDPGLDQSG